VWGLDTVLTASVALLVVVALGALAVLYPAEAAGVVVVAVAWAANLLLFSPRARRAEERWWAERRARRAEDRKHREQVAAAAQAAAMRARGFPESVIGSWLADHDEGGLDQGDRRVE